MAPRPRRPPRAAPPATQAPLDFPAPAPPPPRARASRPDPDELAKIAVARRTKPSAKPGNVRLMLTLDVPRELAERLTARALREEQSLEAVVVGLLERAPVGGR